jgi:hypothetical protein
MGGNESQSEREVKTGYSDEIFSGHYFRSESDDEKSDIPRSQRCTEPETFQEVNGALKPEMILSWFLVEQNLIPLR